MALTRDEAARAPRIISTYEAAEMLGVTHNAIIQAIRDKRLTAVRHGIHKRGAWEIRLSDLTAYRVRQAGQRKPGRPRAEEAHLAVLADARLITAAEVARRAGTTRWAIERLGRLGVIRPALTERRRILYPATVVDQVRRHLGTSAGTSGHDVSGSPIGATENQPQ